MSAETFDSRIAAIHGQGAGDTVIDVRHEEFMAMANAYLGVGFDRTKLAQVESLQLAFHDAQVKLGVQLDAGLIERIAYVDEVNKLHAHVARECETILGAPGFLKLFGVTSAEAAAYIDQEQFLSQA